MSAVFNCTLKQIQCMWRTEFTNCEIERMTEKGLGERVTERNKEEECKVNPV